MPLLKTGEKWYKIITSGCTHCPIGIPVGRRQTLSEQKKKVRILNTESYEAESRKIERKTGSGGKYS